MKLTTWNIEHLAKPLADMNAIDAFWDSYVLGVGVGSTRASSLITTLLATVGAIGTLLLISAIFISAKRALKVSQSAVVAGLAMPLTLMAISIPDLSLPFIWIMLGAVVATAEISSDNKTATHKRILGERT